MTVTPEQWAALLTVAELQKEAAGDRPAENQVRGRSITEKVDELIEFWGRHKATLLPFLTNLAIAALDALVAAQADIDVINPPGPP
jgi:hypothetical protein